MLRHSSRLLLLSLFGLLGLVWSTSLLPAGDPPATPAGAPASAPASAPAPAGCLMIWDGKSATKGKGWAAPKSDKNTMGPSDTAHKGKKSLAFHAVGSGWIGCGWNWFGWWPTDACSDLSGYTSMRFCLRVTGESVPTELTISLVANAKGKPRSVALPISKYVEAPKAKDTAGDATGETAKPKPKFNDGQWHEIVIPLKDFAANKKTPTFDLKSVWEFDVGQWSSGQRDFTAYFDSIRFE